MCDAHEYGVPHLEFVLCVRENAVNIINNALTR